MTDRTAIAGAADAHRREVIALGRRDRGGRGRSARRAFVGGRREIAHLHGDHAAHFAFPRGDAGRPDRRRARAAPPRAAALPRAGAPVASPARRTIRDVIAMMRMNYDRIVARHGTPAGT